MRFSTFCFSPINCIYSGRIIYNAVLNYNASPFFQWKNKKNRIFFADSKTKAIYLHTVKRIFLSEKFLSFKIELRKFVSKNGNGDSFLADWLTTNLNTFLKRACLGLPTGPLACGHLGKKFFFIWGQSQIFEKKRKKP